MATSDSVDLKLDQPLSALIQSQRPRRKSANGSATNGKQRRAAQGGAKKSAVAQPVIAKTTTGPLRKIIKKAAPVRSLAPRSAAQIKSSQLRKRYIPTSSVNRDRRTRRSSEPVAWALQQDQRSIYEQRRIRDKNRNPKDFIESVAIVDAPPPRFRRRAEPPRGEIFIPVSRQDEYFGRAPSQDTRPARGQARGDPRDLRETRDLRESMSRRIGARRERSPLGARRASRRSDRRLSPLAPRRDRSPRSSRRSRLSPEPLPRQRVSMKKRENTALIEKIQTKKKLSLEERFQAVRSGVEFTEVPEGAKKKRGGRRRGGRGRNKPNKN